MDADTRAAIEQLQAQVTTLSAEVQNLRDREAVMEVVHRYAHFIDFARDQEWADLFTEDGAMIVKRRDPSMGQDLNVRGKQALLEFVTGHSKTSAAPYFYDKHVTTQALIKVEGDRATVQSYGYGFDDTPTGFWVPRWGRTVDYLVRQHGKWLIYEHYVLTDVTDPEPKPSAEQLAKFQARNTPEKNWPPRTAPF